MNDHLNLLPVASLRRNLIWVRIRQWSFVWLVTFVTCLSAIGVQTWRVVSQKYRLSQLQVSTLPLRTTQRDLNQILQRMATLRSRESMLAMLERMEQPIQLLGIISRSIGDGRPEVQVYDLVVSPTQVTQIVKSTTAAKDPKGVQPTTKNVERVQLKIDGLGVDDLAVARFVAGLREAGVFETVALKSSIRAVAYPGESRQFSVECVFQ